MASPLSSAAAMPLPDTITFPTLGSPPRFTFPELISDEASINYTSELSSTTSTPFVSAPSSPRFHGFYFSAPTSPCSWAAQGFHAEEAGFQRMWDECPPAQSKMPRILSTTTSAPQTQLQIHGGAIPGSQYENGAEGAKAEIPSRTFRSRQLQAPKRLHMDADAADSSYSRKSFYDSAVPFAWEERPGTPKARSDNSEEDSSSILLSGSSEFEFSARFSELEEPPMSPTPITCSFKHHAFYVCRSPRYDLTQKIDEQNETAQRQETWPLRPPPRLDNPVLPVRQLIREEAHEGSKRNHRPISSLSAPQSPKSPHKFDLWGALCGMSSPTDAVFDPFVAAMEKMAAVADEHDKMGTKKNIVKPLHGHHRRTQSSSPSQGFHWDDCSAKSNSSSNGSCVDNEMKDKHPIEREINARHTSSCERSKGSKRWSLRGFLHKKNPTSEQLNSLRSSERDSSCSGSAGEVPTYSDVDDNYSKFLRPNIKPLGSNILSIPSAPSSPLSSSSSGNSSRSLQSATTVQKAIKAPYALHYSMQRASTQELRKKTFLPYKQGLLGCLGLSSKSYRALTTLSKPLQSVS